MKYSREDIEFDVEFDYRNDVNCILLDLGDRDSILIYRDQLDAMIEALDEADNG